MTNFYHLHQSLQYQIIHSLGWQSLRELQEKSIPIILSCSHVLMIAPTAGGKTEAAIFPILSRMITEKWAGLSVLYICPLKALLNNLGERLRLYSGLIDRKTDVWHGDISDTQRKRILKDQPDIILTTPESIEGMLISTRVNNENLFENVRAVIVDEIHSFAGDDRGWHLLSVVERIQKIAGREIQRIGLSATVGNPKQLLQWLAGFCGGKKEVIEEKGGASKETEIKLDFVGTMENAAHVISLLHAGEKRLVFADSRSRVEELALSLKSREIETYVVHSSLSAEERKQSEEAFSTGKNCVIAATSALELGIDIGDLDRIIQIDSPSTVASFLQRLGRTGRRSNTDRNCLFLAVSDLGFLQSAALIYLWSQGYVEPISPPESPFHVFAQQLLALILQENGIGQNRWKNWIGHVHAFDEMREEEYSGILNHMFHSHILMNDQGIISFGTKGEKLYGFRNFMELCSVFTSPPMMTVIEGKKLIGTVDEITFTGKAKSEVIVLAGKGWQVIDIDWNKKTVQVKPTKLKGRSIWLGSGPALSFKLCNAIKDILIDAGISQYLSQRATEKLKSIREDFSWLRKEATTIRMSDDGLIWWTFAGRIINSTICLMIQQKLHQETSANNLYIKFQDPISQEDIMKLSSSIDEFKNSPDLSDGLIQLTSHIKFNECLANTHLKKLAQNRFLNFERIEEILSNTIRMETIDGFPQDKS